jgi:hypothetical protein
MALASMKENGKMGGVVGCGNLKNTVHQKTKNTAGPKAHN